MTYKRYQPKLRIFVVMSSPAHNDNSIFINETVTKVTS